jgi:flagellar hook-associated protein 2
MTINIGGLASGIDTESIVEQLVSASAAGRTVLRRQQAAVETRATAYATLETRLTSLQEALQAMDSVEEFRGVEATSSNEDAVTVTTSGEAVVGRFSVQVNQLADATMLVSDAFSDRETTGVIAEGTLSITVGGVTTDVTVDSSNSSLDDLVAAINDQVDGVTAYVMNTGDATNPYRLVISGTDTGIDNAVTVDTSGLTGGGGSVPSFTEVTAAADAEVEINGLTITDSDNNIDGAVDGVTFNLLDTTTSAATVTIDRNADAMVEAVQSLVTAWNAVITHIGDERELDTENDIRGSFIGESTPSNLIMRLQSVAANDFASGSVVTALSQMGITTAQNGELELDEDALREAIDDDIDDVVALFSEEDGFGASLQSLIDSYLDEEDGVLTERLEGLDEEIETYDERIAAFDDRLEAYEERLRSQFLQMEIIMARLNQASDSLTALLASLNISTSSSSDDS